jgi:hypothetical protein
MLTGTIRLITKISCGHGNDFPVSIKGREFLQKLSKYWLLTEVCAPWSQDLMLLAY